MEFRAAGFFVVRAPHLPVDTLRSLSREHLVKLASDPAVREAVWVASSSLSKRMTKWLAKPDDKESVKIEQAIARYIERMAGRATPFGLFAGFAVGTVGGETSLEIVGAPRRHVRLDMGALVAISEKLERDPAVRDTLVLRPNNALYPLAGRVHYPELVVEGAVRSYRLAGVDRDEALDAALDHAKNGARRLDIARAVAAKAEVDEEEALAYVDQLIDAHILETNLEPPITGPDALDVLVHELEDGPARETLKQVRVTLDRMNADPMGIPPARYEELAEVVAPLGIGEEDHLVQVDMSHDLRATLSEADVATILEGVRMLDAFDPRDARMSGFIDAFTARYEGREVPLMEVLDEEIGIGFVDPSVPALDPTPLAFGLRLRGEQRHERTDDAIDERSQLLLEKLEAAWSAGRDTITLTEADLAPLAKAANAPLPDSVAAFVTALGDGRFLVHAYTGASAARLLGRFSPWNDVLAERLREHVREEEARRPDAVFAEIVHMPAGSRTGNVLCRPLLRQWEIAFCGRSGDVPERTIPVSDLTLAWRGRLVLRSRKLGKEVIPRLSNAHNFASRQLGVYRFLAALQGQGTNAAGSWRWGRFARARFLPRVEIGKVILSPREWGLDDGEVTRLGGASEEVRMREARRLRDERKLPRHVGLKESDNVLPVDLENALSVSAFGATVKPGARLVELFHDDADLAVRGPGGKYTNEIVVPFLRSTPIPEAAAAPERPPPSRARPPRVQRRFTPGSEWLFAKVYCSRGSIDHLLTAVLAPVIRDAHLPWFFLRYSDPDPHLRLRFHGEPQRLLGDVLPALERAVAPLLAAGRVHRFELATYEREIERYGGPSGVAIAERMFGADSDCALALLPLLEGLPEGRERWGLTLAGMDHMLNDLGFDLAAKERVIEHARRAFVAEHGTTADGEHAVQTRYRTDRSFVEALLRGELDDVAKTAFAVRSEAMKPLVHEMNETGVMNDGLARSLLHMWSNRMLRANARAQELVLTSYLANAYTSLAARLRRSEKKG